MSLLQRVESARQQQEEPAESGANVPAPPPVTAPVSARAVSMNELQALLAKEVLDAWATLIDLANVDQVRKRIIGIVDDSVRRNTAEGGLSLTPDERRRLIEEAVNEITGFGPIEPLLLDPAITEVMVNGPFKVYVERAGRIEKTAIRFRDEAHVLNIIDRIITPIGRRIDETSPRVDARLPDGSRVNAIIPPLSLVGPVITIRKFATRYNVADLVKLGTATPEMFDFLKACVEARLNVFLSGGTGSGKTTTLNVISSFVPEDERIVTIEDSAELLLSQKHVVTLEARPSNMEGEGEITIRDLLKNSLHMRPDRIIVGECRAGEALDMIQAMTTGQEGSLSTGHANTPRDMLNRLETMILMTGYELPLRAIREQIAAAVDVIVHTARLKDGTRKIVSITEIYGIEDDDILSQEIFAFDQAGVAEDGRIQGSLKPTGLRPYFMDAFAIKGIDLPVGEYGIPPRDPTKPRPPGGKARWGVGGQAAVKPTVGHGKAVTAGGMVYLTAIGPIDPDTGDLVGTDIRQQSRQCLANLKTKLEAMGSSLDKVVWANWSLKDRGDFDTFNQEWLRWFSDDGPIGQETLMPQSHRRAGFRISIGVIAALDVAESGRGRDPNERLAALIAADRATPIPVVSPSTQLASIPITPAAKEVAPAGPLGEGPSGPHDAVSAITSPLTEEPRRNA
jgi:pilus assembly protein CpaF